MWETLQASFTFTLQSFFFPHPADIDLLEGLQDTAGCTLQSVGHMTLRLDSRIAAHSLLQRNLAHILPWGQIHKEQWKITIQDDAVCPNIQWHYILPHNSSWLDYVLKQ